MFCMDVLAAGARVAGVTGLLAMITGCAMVLLLLGPQAAAFSDGFMLSMIHTTLQV